MYGISVRAELLARAEGSVLNVTPEKSEAASLLGC
jgi:hypothetical protein